MYIDETIVASLLVVAGTLAVLGGFVYFVVQDIKKSQNKGAEK